MAQKNEIPVSVYCPIIGKLAYLFTDMNRCRGLCGTSGDGMGSDDLYGEPYKRRCAKAGQEGEMIITLEKDGVRVATCDSPVVRMERDLTVPSTPRQLEGMNAEGMG